MSSLPPVRLHFSGRFRADVSTVNNDLSHFNNDEFDPVFQRHSNRDIGDSTQTDRWAAKVHLFEPQCDPVRSGILKGGSLSGQNEFCELDDREGVTNAGAKLKRNALASKKGCV